MSYRELIFTVVAETAEPLSGFLDELLDANPELRLDAAIADREALKSQLVEICESKRAGRLAPLKNGAAPLKMNS